MNKRILINGSMITKMPTGVAIHNIELLRYLLPKLKENNISFDVYCYDAEALKSIISEKYIKFISLGPFFDRFLLRFLSIHRILWNTFLLKGFSQKYDFIYSLSTYGALLNKKQIITVHDLICFSFPKQHRFQFLYFKFVVPFILKASPQIIAISNFTKKEIIRFYPFIKTNQVEIVNNGINHISDVSNETSDIAVEKLSKGKSFCLTIGASYYHKNLQIVLKAAELLIDTDIIFIISGRPSKYYYYLKQQAEAQNLTNVHFIDYANNSLLSSLYKKASLHLYISLYEGFGFPPAEALFYGTNSIISNHPALIEIYGSCFPAVDPTNANEVACKIKEILTSEIKTYDFDCLTTQYNWENAADRVYNILQANIH